MQVKKQIYLGKKTLAIYLNSSTKKIRERILRMKEQEQFMNETQTQNFSSTLSHEMRTPLYTIIFFLEQIIQLFGKLNVFGKEAEQIKLYCSLITNQLNFVLSFVEDLLDLQQMKNGVLQIS